MPAISKHSKSGLVVFIFFTLTLTHHISIMSLITRLPSIFPEINRAFSMLDEPFFNALARHRGSFSAFRPAVDITESDKSYMVEAEVPGMRKEDLDIEFADNSTLILKGKTERTRTVGDPTLADSTESSDSKDIATSSAGTVVSQPTRWEQERFYGAFQRTFTFPSNVDSSKAKASYKDGILSIEVPKVEKQTNKIAIEHLSN